MVERRQQRGHIERGRSAEPNREGPHDTRASTRPADEVLPVGLHRFDDAAAAAGVDGFREIGDNCSLVVALDAMAQMLEGAGGWPRPSMLPSRAEP